jgi:hypothetical protein
MNTDGHTASPLEDLTGKIERANPSSFSYLTPPPKLPTLTRTNEEYPSVPIARPVVAEVAQAVEAAFQRVRINGESPRFQGSAISFELPAPRASSAPVISEVAHPTPVVHPQVEGKIARLENGQAYAEAKTYVSGHLIDQVRGEGRILGRSKTPEAEEPNRVERGVSIAKMSENRRQEGETKGDWKERKKELKSFESSPAISSAVAHGDATFFSSGYVPVLFTRADGARKILTYVIEDNSSVIEGAAPFEKAGALPPSDSYYIAGGGSSDGAFKISIIAPVAPSTTYKYRVSQGTIANGTNGAALPINGLGTDKTASAGKVYIKGTVGSNLEVTGLTVSAGDGDTKEVVMSGRTQSEMNLVLGTITITKGVPSVKQDWATSAMVVNGFLNGALVKVFAAAPTVS